MRLDIDEEIDHVPDDTRWETKIGVQIAPSPSLPENAAKIVEADYGMTNGLLTIDIRRAMLKYFLIENGFSMGPKSGPSKETNFRGDNGLVAIANMDSVKSVLLESMNDSVPNE